MNKARKIVVPGIPAVPASEIEHCTQCPHHKIEEDPDPTDWFCDDDVKIRCTLSKARYRGNHAHEPYVTVGCRPYRTNKEDDIPDWCPLIKHPSKATPEIENVGRGTPHGGCVADPS